MNREQLEAILSRHTHRMHGGTEYYSREGVLAAMQEVDPQVTPMECAERLCKVRDPKTFDVGQWYGKTEIIPAMEAVAAAMDCPTCGNPV